MVYNAGTRFDRGMYVTYEFDSNTGDVVFVVEETNEFGYVTRITGTVTWD